jgi:hypothetical protein
MRSKNYILQQIKDILEEKNYSDEEIIRIISDKEKLTVYELLMYKKEISNIESNENDFVPITTRLKTPLL